MGIISGGGGVGAMPVTVTPGDTQEIITGDGLPNAKITADVGANGNLGGMNLIVQSDDDGRAFVGLFDGGTKDGIITVATTTGIYAQPRSDASAGNTIVEVTDTSGNDVFVVEVDAKIGFFGHAPAAQQTLTSGTATPEQIALALEASTLMAGT